jgi:MFS family permease
MPKFECRDPLDPDLWRECSRAEVCADIGNSRVDKSDALSLDNWVGQLDLTCASEAEIGSLGSLFFLGMLVVCLPIPRLADKHGRKQLIVASGCL